MSKHLVAKRYALALFQLAQEQNAVNEFEEQLLVIKKVFEENRELLVVLKHPKVSFEQKQALLKEAFSTLLPQIQNTLSLLLERHRIGIVIEMVSDFVELANESKGTAEATVYSVRPLTENEGQALSESFARKVGRQSLKIQNIVDKSLIGGVKLRIGNRIYDGSVSGKLERIQRQLLANRS
ncbi:F0F1 ATP synthase subunit delta [Bacillus songklensis]|uniref:ATP synthase subunit delta n=1 Tax=Bacillus songklensis TaxID=1069116 RepID=A0ABV8BBA9_9BACI